MRCHKCHRQLKNPVYVNGLPFGHVCARKIVKCKNSEEYF